MKLRPDTIAAHRARHSYPPHTLAPDTHQRELDLRPQRCPTVRRFADMCPRCKGIHTSPADAEHCRQANAQHEQY